MAGARRGDWFDAAAHLRLDAAMGESKYKLAVFDLDFTLWDAGGTWCDCLTPPFRKTAQGVLDARSAKVRVYEDALWALERCRELDLDVAVASRTNEPDWARELLDLLELRDRFRWEEIYPSSKVRHFAALKEKSGYIYEEMLFFDDERRNIVEVGALGVRAVHVRDGFRRGVAEKELG
ncbi:magnesium-dependent phosphatase-1 [Pelagicoccus sp. SDUM812003]|uniref:magnesium-dependent phosphatase-1 n=1 Tax=Pelagicoccus sp. SDUM812003 TaxID=3041267 RepID=UPI00280E1D24|nr:magnesium-dependent phosphatase-1 [Pelagicoccus sp. SDUM812003]MDQ8205259.1 magnesium-dependent phosphatase-1 [Pelagicoccus sp. SDUM812003]